ncbi:MAG: mitochondrial small ribosomal subunit protein uS17m [Rickettsiales bacterium]|jgi:small subunit ribosomal protein S17|nr:mitochondrial small ribosomal subunit protein uS17m [Rickettsiales bacterium]
MKVKIEKIIDEKTLKVVATSYKKHKLYGKYITTHKNYLVDYSGQKVNVGDEVEIVSTRPISKRKKWALKV